MCSIAEHSTNAGDALCVMSVARASASVRPLEWDYNSCPFSDNQCISGKEQVSLR